MKTKQTNDTPQIGDRIYVPSSFHISRGEDDVVGGLATITRVYKSMSGGDPNCIFVDVEEHPNKGYNWTQRISKDQKKLKKTFGKKRAYPDPDINTPWLEPGDHYSSYDGRTGQTTSGIYKGPPVW